MRTGSQRQAVWRSALQVRNRRSRLASLWRVREGTYKRH